MQSVGLTISSMGSSRQHLFYGRRSLRLQGGWDNGRQRWFFLFSLYRHHDFSSFFRDTHYFPAVYHNSRLPWSLATLLILFSYIPPCGYTTTSLSHYAREFIDMRTVDILARGIWYHTPCATFRGVNYSRKKQHVDQKDLI